MGILITEDDYDTAISYKRELEERKHHLVITDNGEDCLKVYPEQLHDLSLKTNGSSLHITRMSLPSKTDVNFLYFPGF